MLFNLSIAAIVGASILSLNMPASVVQGGVASNVNAKHKTVQSISNKPITKPKLPAVVQPTVVTVNPGDNLTLIASENNTTAIRIFYANLNIVNPDLIYPEEQLTIPLPNEALSPRPIPVNQTIVAPTVSPPPLATPATTPVPVSTASNTGTNVWDEIASCESGGNWSINTGNGYYGGLQFTLSSWQSVGGTGLPSEASQSEQIALAQILQSREGWGAWPVCSAKFGL